MQIDVAIEKLREQSFPDWEPDWQPLPLYLLPSAAQANHAKHPVAPAACGSMPLSCDTIRKHSPLPVGIKTGSVAVGLTLFLT